MQENFYLRPQYTLTKKTKHKAKPEFIEIIKPIKNHNFKVEKLIDVKKYLLKNNYLKSLSKYKNLKNRINKILKEKNLNVFKNKKPVIMGILNLTRDSFYDGGKYINRRNALIHADKMLNEGADVIDVGAESTRPGASPINVDLEIKRVIPIIKQLTKNKVKVSCDTRNAFTMEMALDAGASIINDVSGLNYDKNTFSTIKKYNCSYILTHSKGTPISMQNNPIYKNVICDIHSFFKNSLNKLENMNISTKNIILDPGMGFGKKDIHNFSILKNFPVFHDLGFPLLVGVSRKSFIQKFIKSSKEQTLTASVTLALSAYLKGCSILRVHDVKDTLDALNIFSKVS